VINLAQNPIHQVPVIYEDNQVMNNLLMKMIKAMKYNYRKKQEDMGRKR
jgi:hypothetical protein